jgi:transketolase
MSCYSSSAFLLRIKKSRSNFYGLITAVTGTLCTTNCTINLDHLGLFDRETEKSRMTPITHLDLIALQEKARQIRLDILEMTTKAGSGHPSSSWSATEILVALYFGGILQYRPEEPWWPERDRFIMSKGHAAPLLYAVLAMAGYFEREELWRLRQIDSPVQGHPIQGMMPGVEATTGSLGQGLSLGIGHILGGRLNGLNYSVYTLLGDGECEAGQIWEAAMAAAHFKTGNLKAILDYNKYQETGPISREMGLEPLAQKWESFGWHVEEVDGHDLAALIDAFKRLQAVTDRPSILIAHTIKGKGVSFVEADFTFHGRALTPEQAIRAREEINAAR